MTKRGQRGHREGTEWGQRGLEATLEEEMAAHTWMLKGRALIKRGGER